jgi:hypothetical protein
MYINTIEDLQKYLDSDICWRKKELTAINFFVKNDTLKDPDLSVRLGIVMVYAHWEGFIKNSGNFYINYLKQLGLNYSELKENFVALSLRGQFTNCETTNKTTLHCSIVNILLNEQNTQANLPAEDAIITNSNLNFQTLEEILFTLGLKDASWKKDLELKKALIDYTFLKNRNEIAHGIRTKPTISDFNNVYSEIVPLLNLIKEKILDAAEHEKFKRVT